MAAEVPDGRLSRTARSRQAICDACLDLVQEGVLQPGADQVAARAGVSRRSIFNHFTDLAELYDAVVEVGLARCAPLVEEVSEDESVPRRVERLVAARVKFLEATAEFARALTAQALVGPAEDQARRVSRDGAREQRAELERLFGADLERLPAAERAEALDALSAAMAPLLWETLRRVRGGSVARSRSIMKRMVLAILRDVGVDV